MVLCCNVTTWLIIESKRNDKIKSEFIEFVMTVQSFKLKYSSAFSKKILMPIFIIGAMDPDEEAPHI